MLTPISRILVVAILLPALSWASEINGRAGDEAKMGFVAGQVLKSGKTPLANGMVLLFDDALGPPPSREKYWRVPDIVAELDKNGKFELGIPEGTYYLIALDKMAVKDLRPPEVDTNFYYHADPQENPRIVRVTPQMLTDMGVISTSFPFRRAMVTQDKNVTAIEGTVLDLSGSPVEGALVLAYPFFAANPRPLFVSERSGKDGKFILRTHDGGNYYLRVRGVYGGGPPEAGEVVGSSGPADMVPVLLKKGEKLKGIVLRAKRFPQRGQEQPE